MDEKKRNIQIMRGLAVLLVVYTDLDCVLWSR